MFSIDEKLEIGVNPYRGSYAGIVPTDVPKQIIPPKENWKRECNFKFHVPNVWQIARKCVVRTGGVWVEPTESTPE